MQPNTSPAALSPRFPWASHCSCLFAAYYTISAVSTASPRHTAANPSRTIQPQVFLVPHFKIHSSFSSFKQHSMSANIQQLEGMWDYLSSSFPITTLLILIAYAGPFTFLNLFLSQTPCHHLRLPERAQKSPHESFHNPK